MSSHIVNGRPARTKATEAALRDRGAAEGAASPDIAEKYDDITKKC